MSNTQGDLASLSRFIFRAPSWYSSIAFALLIAAFAGVAAFDSRFVLEDAWEGIFYIGLPTVAASQVSASSDARFGVSCPPNSRSTAGVSSEAATVGRPI